MPDFSLIDQQVAELLPILSEKQRLYLREVGRCIQFVHDGTKSMAVDGRYAQIRESDKLSLPSGSISASIHVYETPTREHGCWLVLKTVIDKVEYERSITVFGPENRNEDWHALVPESRKQDII